MTWYCLIAKKIIIIPLISKLTELWHQRTYVLFCTNKKFKSQTPIRFITFCSNVNDSVSISRIFFGDVSISNKRTWKLLQNIPNILPQSTCMKSWYHDKFYDFLNLFAFNGILERFVQTVLSMVRDQNLRNLLLFQAYVITLNSLPWK